MQPFEFPFNPKEARDQFDTAYRTAQSIHSQNVRYSELEDIQNPDLLNIAREGLADEQRETVSQLEELSDQAPYEAVARAEMALARQLGQATMVLDQAADTLKPFYEGIDNDAQRASELSPLVVQRIAAKAAELKREEEIRVTGVDRKVVEKMQFQYAAIEDMYRRGGEAWPAPRALYDFIQSIKQVENEFGAAGQPLAAEAPEVDTFEAFLQRLGVEKPGIIHHISYFFIERPGEIVSIGDLADLLTEKNLTSPGTDAQKRNRVMAMLSRNQQGQKIRRILEQEDFVLQHGLFAVYGPDGKKVIERPHRVFRVVSGDDPEASLTGEFMVSITQSPFEIIEEPNQEELAAGDSEAEKSWQEALTDRVNKAIAELAADELMVGLPLPVTVVRRKSSSAKMGTREAVTRLARAHLLPQSAERNPDDVILTPAQMVLMDVFNATPELSRRNRSLQREAHELILLQVEQYFERLREQARRKDAN